MSNIQKDHQTKVHDAKQSKETDWMIPDSREHICAHSVSIIAQYFGKCSITYAYNRTDASERFTYIHHHTWARGFFESGVFRQNAISLLGALRHCVAIAPQCDENNGRLRSLRRLRWPHFQAKVAQSRDNYPCMPARGVYRRRICLSD
jgi:hypothetical protein